MKVAILSDIHSNLEALRACLAHANAQGADRHAFLGDLVGYGADPLACLDIIETFVSKGAIAVCGNHDEATLTGWCEDMNFAARDAIYWTRSQLGPKERAFLQGLPMFVKQEDTLYVHASADDPGRWTYVDSAKQAARCMNAAETAFIFAGHVHSPALYFSSDRSAARAFPPAPGVPIPVASYRRWLAIVGSVGQPRDGNNAASYAIHDRKQKTLTFFRVPYDYVSTARKILAAGLPQRLAQRLESGH